MGFGCGRCFDRCDDCVGGYGDGPCGGYYSFWDRCGCAPGFNRGRCGCFPSFGWDRNCWNRRCCGRGFGCGRECCGRGFGCGRECCGRGFGCGRECCGFRNPFRGICFNIPFGCGSLGFFL